MGNSQSTPKSHTILPTHSAGISRHFRSCCTVGSSFRSSAASEETYCNDGSDNLSFKYAHKSPNLVDNDTAVAYKAFLKAFPEYQLTSTLDDLRASDFSRLDQTGETYVDYMGGGMHPESLIRRYSLFLNNNILGNTHSVSNR
jgi:molybdenum cofactor sulfurtransferase